MEDKLISIIVPVFNAERYLERCIDSILNQTYPNIEVLLVDDGSTDKSGIICDRFGTLDCRVKVIHKQNEGVTKARMTALDACKGDFVTFIDSDDYVDIHIIEELYKAVKEYHVEASICQVILKYDNSEVVHVRKEIGFFDSQDIVRMLSTDFLFDYSRKEPGLFLGQCGKLFSKKLVVESIKQSEGLWVGEDLVMLLHMMYQISSLYISSKPLYYYVQHSGQATRKSDDSFWVNIVAHWEKLVEIDRKGFLLNQLPYRILQYFEVYVRNNIDDNIKFEDFKVKTQKALSPEIVNKYLLNYNFSYLTIADNVFVNLIRHNRFLPLYYLCRVVNYFYKLKKLFKR